MIARTLLLALCGCGGAVGALHAGLAGPDAASDAGGEPAYHEMPLAAVPVIRGGRVEGLSFVRLGLVAAGAGEGAIDPNVLKTFVADALHDATLGQPGGVSAAAPHIVAPPPLRAALPVRLRRAGAPFRALRVVVLQAEFRSRDRLRSLSGRSAAAQPDGYGAGER